MEIRSLSQDELPVLLALYGHLHHSDSPLPIQAEINAVWSEIMANNRIRYVGGFIDGRLISSCNISIIPNLTRSCRPYGIIENVVTHPAYRKQGYGTAVLHDALAYAWSVGCYKVMLLTGRKDEDTLRFYASAGFDSQSKQAFIAKPGHLAL